MMDKKTFLQTYLTDRHGTYCSKWDELDAKFGEKDLIGMWIADMEFKVPECIRKALAERVQHGVFGYSYVPEEYYKAFSDWMERRYHFPIEKDWVRFSTGCVTSLAWAIGAFTKPGEAVMILTPVYYPFHNVVTYNSRKLVKVDLHYDKGYFTMDYDAIEKAILDNDVKLFLQCSPHNPAGRVWTEEELEKHHVLVVSDEIHQDIVPGDHPFIPAAMVKGGKYRHNLITLNSSSKTFNLASLLHSHILITDKALRDQYDAYASGMNRNAISIMGVLATMAGYEQGEEWLEAMVSVVRDNYTYLKETLAAQLPDVTVCCLEGTYLVLVDLRSCAKPEEIVEFVQHKCHLGVDYGEWFGANYAGFIRLNLATDPRLVQQAVANIVAAGTK